ncbi:hypothetical protein C8R42DRAFT_440069 [Lentinula raphanica]|nr:hypothetical protein C8R42DRAFT_440069 [Lentinula raphanica]
MSWPSVDGFIVNRNATWSTDTPSPSQPGSHVVKEAIFEFPTSADRLFCLSRGFGPLAGGAFCLTQSDRVRAGVVEVKVIVEYWAGNTATLDSILRVCELTRRENQHGVGILTRPLLGLGMNSQFHASIKVVVTLPIGPQSAGVLKLKNFETDMPLFSHLVDNLSSTVYFRTVSFRTTNAPILVESINVGKANISTDNGPIEGSFTSKASLRMATNNSPIRVSVCLQNTDATSFSELNMRTSNGPINGSITLGAPSSSTTSSPERGGNFLVNAATHLGALSLTFPSAPPLCNLHLLGSTSLGPVEITLPKTYEGSFEAQTSMGFTSIGFGNGMGIQRRRMGYEQNEMNVKKGWICTSDEGRWRGEAKITTSMAPVTLVL